MDGPTDTDGAARLLVIVTRALHFAALKHVDQRRKGARAEPYLNHLTEVAWLLAEATAGRDPDLVVAGVLHDTIEDTEATEDEIAGEFGAAVAALVREVTDDKRLPKAERKRLQVVGAPHKSPRAKQLKLADKISNLEALAASPPVDWPIERRRAYVRWAAEVAAGCRGVNAWLDARFDRAHGAADAALAGGGFSDSTILRWKSGARPATPALMEDKPTKTREEWLEQARVLVEALPFMRRYAGATFVIKYGGHAMGETERAREFARDVVLLRQVGINPVVVHGGGPQIGRMLERLKIKSEFVDGLRVTDKDTVDVVEMVLAGSINKEIVTAINAAGGFAVGLSGKDGNLIRAQRLRRTKRDPGSNIERILDLGLVGEPSEINPHILDFYERSDITPVIAPIGVGPGGETLNINADTAAGAIAAAIGAQRFILLTDVEGVLDDNHELIAEMTASEARRLITDGVITGGMIPKIETCLDAIDRGVEGAVIVDGRVPHVLLLELFTEHGAGTLVKAN
jgi:acetylglutamate kinase